MTKTNNKETAILLVYCNDRKGISAKITNFLCENNGNIINIDQHVDIRSNFYFLRVEWELYSFKIEKDEIGKIFEREIAKEYLMFWELHFSNEIPKMAIFVSKYSHCLYDILSRAKEWKVQIPLIVSNHKDLEYIANQFKIDFYYFPVTKENKSKQEEKEINLIKEQKIDFIVLARYMQILSKKFVDNFPHKIINIHHSFLPAFTGAKPYHSAYLRGVKVIGATSHYVTKDLDEGPIIEQDIIRVSHKDRIEDFIRKGKDLEKIVLSRAIWYQINRKIIVYNNKTVIFE